MKRFKITYGCGMGSTEEDIITARNLDHANKIAWEAACQDYDNYAGMHGLRDLDEIMEEDGVDEDEAVQIYEDERESWLEYDAEEIS